MTISITAGEDRVALFDELESIVLRANSLGLSRHRVATALRISPADLAQIEHRHDLATASHSCPPGTAESRR